MFFYVIGALLIGMIVPYDNEQLSNGSGNASASPFVIAIQNAGIKALPSIVNACVLISAWSAGNSYCYVGARIIMAMAIDRQLPQCFATVNRWGVPHWAVIASFAFGPLAYLSLGSGGPAEAFNWILVLSTLAGLLAWMTLCIAYIRFYRGVQVQGIDRSTFPYRGRFQPYTAWFGTIGSLSEFLLAPCVCSRACANPIVIILFSGFSVFLKGNWSVSDFIANYIGLPIYIIPFVLWKVFKKSKFVRASEMDFKSGLWDPRDAPEEPEPTTWWGKFIDWLF